jgi:hypothetical protein
VAWRDAQIPRPQILYWRTASGEEVDLVIEHPRGLLPIEVKATARPSTRDARHLRTFCEEYADRVQERLLLHDGEEIFWIGRGILAAPWWRVIWASGGNHPFPGTPAMRLCGNLRHTRVPRPGVALLLAEGKSDAEIARELVISWHTARRHVEKVLLKLGVHSRAEAGARILRG